MATYQNSIANLGVRLVITHQSPDIANNKTTINYSAYVYKTNGSPWNKLSQTPMKLTINGQSLINISNGNYDLSGVSQQLIKSGTLTIPHNSDGTKSFSFSWNVNFTSTGYGYGNVTTSGTYTLPTIPRTSTFSVASTMNTGTNYTLTISKSSDSFTHDVTYTVGGVETNVATSTTAKSVTVNIPHALFNKYPSNSTVTGTINVKTKNGSSVIGIKSQNVSINLPTNFKPSVSKLSVSNTRHAPMTTTNQFIRGISRMTLTASEAKGAYSSTINGYEFRYKRANGNYEGVVSSSKNSFQYGVFLFPNSGSEVLTVETRVWDSRGRYSDWKSLASAVRIHFYQPPSIGNIRVWRTGANNTSLNVERSYKVTPLYTGGGKTNNNTASLSFETKELGKTASTNTGAKSSTMSLDKKNATLSGTFAANKSYEVRAVLKDSIQTVYGSWIRVSTESLPMTIAPKGIGVGKAHSGGSYNLEVGSGGASIEGGAKIDGSLRVVGNLRVDGELTPKYVPPGANLNNYTSPGFYYNGANSEVGTMSNKPTGNAFSMLVMKHAGVVQILTEYMTSGAKTFIRNYYSGSWGSWTTVVNENDVKTLLAGSPSNFDNNTFIQMVKTGLGKTETGFNANNFLHGIVWCYGSNTGTPSVDGLLYAYRINSNQATQIYFGMDNRVYQRQRDWKTKTWGGWGTEISGNGSASSSGYTLFGDYQIAFGKITINKFFSAYTLTGNATFYRNFVEPPVITLTAYTGSGSTYHAGDGYVQTVTNSGFTAAFSNTGFKSGDSRTLNYVAVGKGR